MKNYIYYFIDFLVNSFKFNGLIRGLQVVIATLIFKFGFKIHPNTSTVLGMKFNYLNKTSIVNMLYDFFCSGTYYFESNKKNPVIFDVGANIGDSLLYFKWLYPESVIYAFEPHNDAFLILQKNVKDNKFKKILLYNFGLGKEKKKTVLYSNKDNTFYSSSEFKGVIRNQGEILKSTVSIENIGEISAFKKIKTIDLIKLDVEGAEMGAIQSMESLLDRTRCVILEYHLLDSISSNSFDKIISLLKKHEFSINIFGSYRSVRNNTNPFVFFIKAERM